MRARFYFQGFDVFLVSILIVQLDIIFPSAILIIKNSFYIVL